MVFVFLSLLQVEALLCLPAAFGGVTDFTVVLFDDVDSGAEGA